jgi:orotate phosphoribosyltransferase/AMMECR1 domain-containing protein
VPQSVRAVSSRSSEQGRGERAELLELLLRDGILHRSPTQPVLSRDGSSARWMLDSLAVSMRPRGAKLAGRCLLALLEKFEGRQLATYGLTGVPLMQSVILQSHGRYHGLIVRKEKKAHGSLRRIEGQIDLGEPTILIDDSISSGLSMEESSRYLEEAGLWVEGGVVLVRFGWEGGASEMEERGFHMEAVYDVWEDLMENMEGELRVDRNPTKHCADFPWGQQRAPEGLHPAHLARLALEEYFRSGTLPRPPQRLDADYDSGGGVWISLRDKEEIYNRHARDGFWHFPGEPVPPTPEAVLRAAFQTALSLGESEKALATVAGSHIAVTFFTALEACTPGQLDNDRYGIVVCSRERPSEMGGALPRMPGIANEWEQFRHAWKKNAELLPFEPYTIYRHDVRKLVEPGAIWQPSGTPADAIPSWHSDPSIGGRLAERARQIALEKVFALPEEQSSLPADLLPSQADSIYISVYLDGKLRGCMGSALQGMGVQELEQKLRVLVKSALEDGRFAQQEEDDESEPPELVAVSVSLLFNPLELGDLSPEEVGPRFQLARQALAVSQNQRYGMVLPFVAVTHNLDREAFVDEVIDKAGVTRPSYLWERFDCATWLADHHGTDLLECGFRPPSADVKFEKNLLELADWHSTYLLQHQSDDGSLYFHYEPFQNCVYPGGGAPRSTHAAWVMMRASRLLDREDLREGADKLLNLHLAALRESDDGPWLEEEDNSSSVSELSFLLLALCELTPDDPRREPASRIASLLWSRIDRHGRVATHRDPAAESDEFQDYFPGQLLLALAGAALAGIAPVIITPVIRAPIGEDAGHNDDQGIYQQVQHNKDKLCRALRCYRHRYRYKRNFGQVSWMIQAARRWWQVTRDPAWAELAFEIGDWIRTFQLAKNGGFINDHQDDGPGYTTALYLEGIGAAAALAGEQGDRQRERDYLECCKDGLRFLRKLVIRPEHDTVLPAPDYALGGLRGSLTSSEIRIDFVQHSLAAVLELYAHLGLAEFVKGSTETTGPHFDSRYK